MKNLIVFSLVLIQMIGYAQTIINYTSTNISSGWLERIDKFQSKFVDARNVDIWLPESYSASEKYDVVYMHDGQMLFDSTQTWNHQAWEVDDVAAKLMQEGKVRNFIVVGIWNNGESRHADYFPQKPFEYLTQEQKDYISTQLKSSGRILNTFNPVSDNYLKFLITELKPLIDSTYSVYADREHTFIAGSSMGGLISMYAICEYPEIFGGAACMSTHWPGIFSVENNPIPSAFVSYLRDNLPDHKTHKLYFDYGDQTLDALYPQFQKKADKVIQDKGYSENEWMTKYFPGDDHSEKSWSKRLDIPLEFLLKE